MAKAFLIAAPWSNSGKTTLTLGLSRYLRNHNYDVQLFKCGPDYIDTIHHSTASNKPSINLDTIMMSDNHVKEIFAKYSKQSEISIVEGVMGLFDGAVKDKGSSAEIAKLLDIPVILVVNAKSMAYTIAPILYGLKTFDPKVKIAGVIFNFVKTESHYAFLKEACETVGLKSLGYVPENKEIKIPSRHLGLHIDETFESIIEKAANHLSTHISINDILNCSKEVQLLTVSLKNNNTSKKPIKIAIAKDEAFTFTYYENLKYLERKGTVVYFSPLHDSKLPEADIIYLAGGYPELYLEKLEKNKAMQNAIKKAAISGKKIWAECGGMMYLGKSIIDENEDSYEMVGVFDFVTSMNNKKLALGYRKIVINDMTIWGHEFHYSKITGDKLIPEIGEVFSGRNKKVDTKIYQYKNTHASYIHVYWGELAEEFELV